MVLDFKPAGSSEHTTFKAEVLSSSISVHGIQNEDLPGYQEAG